MSQASPATAFQHTPCACQQGNKHTGAAGEPCQRRLQVAAAARQIIAEKGLEGLRTRDIAERAGINIATLHYHVPTKEDLIHLVAESVRSDFIAQDLAHPRDTMTPRQKLRQEIDDFAELITHRRDLLTVMSEFSERERRDEIVCGVFSQMRVRWEQTFIDIFNEGVAEGCFRAAIDPAQSARIVISALIGAGKRAELGQGNFEGYFNQLERLFLTDAEIKSGHN